MAKLVPYLYLISAIAIGILAIATFVDLVRAILFPNTLTAIETAIGSAVICIALSVICTKLFKTGRSKIKLSS